MRIELNNRDCLEAMREMTDKQFDLAIVDPPYGININSSGRLGHYGGKGKTWDKETPSEEYFIQLERVSKNRIVWGANYFNMPPTRCFLIWDKQQPQGVSFASCEYAWTSFDQSAKTFYKRPQGADEQRIHPTQKPVKLYEWLLDNYAEEGQTILDTHLGSGSIALACHNRGYSLTAFEIDKEYFEAAKKRLEIHQAQLTMF